MFENDHVIDCDKPGCSYVAEGRTRRQALQRLSDHWTAKDHREHVDGILRHQNGGQ